MADKGVLSEILGPEHEEGESSPGSLHTCMHELIEAIHARNVPDAVAALKACVAECESDEYED